MELEVNVEIYKINSRRRVTKRVLVGSAFVHLKNFEDNWHLHVRSRNNRRRILKYQIVNNIDIYEEYMSEGKFTVKFLHPCHEIRMADSICSYSEDYYRALQIMRFARYYVGSPYFDDLLLHYDPKSRSKRRGVIFAHRGNYVYQKAHDFPEKTTHIYINGLDRKSIDWQILKLPNLSVLDLSRNKISSLPKGLGDLENLRELYLSHNYLGSARNWEWLTRDIIQEKLTLLDISCNRLKTLPLEITTMKLTTLVANRNLLTVIPQKFMCSLGTLDLSSNRLPYLPRNLFSCMFLNYIDVSDNPIHTDTEIVLESTKESPMKEETPSAEVPSLMRLAAKCIISHRIQYTRIPSTLIDYLHNAEITKYCFLCERVCTDDSMNVLISLPLSFYDKIACKIKTSRNEPIILQNYYCSMRCRRYIIYNIFNKDT